MEEIQYDRFVSELDAAIQAHLEWTRRILRCAVLRTSPGNDVMKTEAHTLCRFGRWFTQNRNIFEALDMEKSRALEINHRSMHDAMRDICNDVLSGMAGDAANLSAFETTQTLLIEYLSHFKTLSTQIGSQLDPLTALPLRHRIEQNFELLKRHARRQGHMPAVALIDIDHFKAINDRHGHAGGDLVLKELADCLKNSIRETDQAYRYGGEEFLVLIELTAAPGAEIWGKRALESVRALSAALPDGTLQNLTVTIGIALVDGQESLNKTIQRADMALYSGKASGRNRCVVAPEPALA